MIAELLVPLGQVDWTNPDFLRQKWEDGGWTMYLLAFCSVMMVAFVAERLVRLRRSTVVPVGLARTADALWKRGNLVELQTLVQSNSSSLSRVIGYILRHRNRTTAEVSQGVSEVAVRELRPHFRRAYPLLVVATVAPLLGLFGTVLGMMEAFQQFRMLGEEGDPGVFAQSISKALLTTIFGLMVAILSLSAYHFFKTRTNRFGDILEADTSDIIDEWLATREVANAR